MAQSFEAWWAALGPIAKGSVIAPSAIALAVSLGIAPPFLFILIWDRVINDFEIWRLVTSAVFFGKFSFAFLMNVAMFVVYQRRHEEDFGPRLCDHVYMLTVLLTTLLTVSYFMDMMVLSFSLTMALIWIWCKRHEDAVLSVYGFSFKGQHFPFVMLLVHLLLGQSIVDDIVGIIVGHLFYFLKDMLPQTNGLRLLETPSWVEKWFPNSAQTIYGVHIPATHRAAPQAPRQQWGQGRALGGGN